MNITVDGLAWLPISEMGKVQADWLRRKLTIADAPGRRAVLTRFYVEDPDNDRFGVPRGFFFDGVTKEHAVKEEVSFGDIWPDRRDDPNASWLADQSDDEKELTLLGSFDDESRRGVQAALRYFGSRDVAEGILHFPATADAYLVCLALVRILRLRTLILVGDEVSAEYWLSAISQTLPDAFVGLSPSNHVGVSTVDDIGQYLGLGATESSFGMVIAADLDIVDVAKWSSVISQFPAAKRVGVASGALDLSGPRRAISYHVGGRVFTGKRVQLVPKIRRVWSQWRLGGSSRVNPLFISKDSVVSSMATSAVYNQHVVEQVVLAAKADRRVVVFSEHLNHLRVLRKEIEAAWVGDISIDYLVEGMGRADVAEAISSRVILTMYSKARTLPEMAEIDTVVLATPVKDPLDAVSCSLVPGTDKKDPVVVDMRCDGIPVCKEYGAVRDGVYQRVYGEERG